MIASHSRFQFYPMNRMILIADSGSTKTDWRTIDSSGKIAQVKTAGMNPYQQTTQDIYLEIKERLLPILTEIPSSIHFYGAGCAAEANAAMVKAAIQQAFPQSDIRVSHDLLAAAHALCDKQPGIACILGTGSNSSLYDGEKIIMQQPSLGFILGDEGSGAVMGKKLISLYLTKDLPEHIMKKMDEKFDTHLDEVLQNVYKQPFPNRYLAGFSTILFENLKDPFIYRFVYEQFQQFFENTVCRYPDYKEHKVHFVGSIAYYYSNILRQVASDHRITVRNILETPIAGLTLYHQHQI